ncbi:DsrE family protein [Vagococcus sp. JNUCC 83]
MKVVFHIHDEEMWGICLANVRNFVEVCGEKGYESIEVVANGPAIKGYLNETICKKIEEITLENVVTFSSCQKAMTNQQINSQDFLTNISVVQSGVYRLVERQQMGYAYIKV